MKAAVLLVDDHTLVREVVASVLNESADFEVCAQAATADQAMERCAEREPDIVLLDIDMPGMDAFEAARAIRQRHPRVKLVFLSAYTSDRFIDQAMDIGCDGYFTKGQSTDELVSALHEVVRGNSYFSPQVRARLVVERSRDDLRGAHTRARSLTEREREVLEQIASGITKKEIAEKMGLSVKTIEKHAANIMSKLDMHDRVALSRYCIREQIITA